jgi:hypothetical protein
MNRAVRILIEQVVEVFFAFNLRKQEEETGK